MDETGSRPDTRVFLSYSRKDRDFVERLAPALAARGCLPDYDLSAEAAGADVGISAEDEWWTRLKEMIAWADVVVLVLSPFSVQSRVCDEEVAYARALGKRVVPVLCRPIDFATAPPRISALNVKIDFTDDSTSGFHGALEALVTVIRRDARWFRAVSRHTAAAQRWEAAGSPDDLLLHGAEVREAEELALRRPRSAPAFSDLLLRYLDASRKLDAERRAISEAERARYLELVAVMRPFLEEELRIRESMPAPDQYGIAEEFVRQENEMVRSLLNLQNRWHPEPAVFIASLGAMEGYAEVFRFPCCDLTVRDFLSAGAADPPSQFRSDGCREVPVSVQHQVRERSYPFCPVLVTQYRRLAGSGDT